MFGGTSTESPRWSWFAFHSGCAATTWSSTSDERITWASVSRLVISSCRTDDGVGTNGFPALGFTSTRAVLVYVAGEDVE